MKIAIFSDNFYPELSGISDSVVALAKQLAAQGHFVNFYAPWYSKKNYDTAGRDYRELDLGPNVRIERYLSVPFPGPTKQARIVLPTFWRWLKVRQFHPDVIHTQLFSGVGWEAIIAGKLLGVPIVGTNHTLIKEFIRYSPIHYKWFEKLSLRYASWYYNCCDFVTTPSNWVFNEMSENGLKKPHKTISNPIDTELFQPPVRSKADLKKQFGLTGPTLVYAGRMAKEKDVDVIIRAVVLAKKRLPDLTLALAGHGTEEPALKQLAKQLGVETSIKFLGTLHKHELCLLFQACDIITIASTSETQNMSLMQAMACGLPALGADSKALPEYINQKTGFLFPPGDSQTLADNLTKILTEPGLYEKLSAGAVEFTQQFSAPAIAKQWLEIYSNVISAKKAKSTSVNLPR